jgi:hypothetical protein
MDIAHIHLVGAQAESTEIMCVMANRSGATHLRSRNPRLIELISITIPTVDYLYPWTLIHIVRIESERRETDGLNEGYHIETIARRASG